MADYQKMRENIKLICERVSVGERMAMLAEETAELADAAQLLHDRVRLVVGDVVAQRIARHAQRVGDIVER